MATGDDASSTPQPGSVVTIECRLEPEEDFVPEPLIDGVVLRHEDPAITLKFVLGAGNYLPGLHDLVADMVPGEEGCDKVPLDAGWGARNPDLVAQATFADSGLDPSQIKIGTELQLANGMKCTVTEMDDSNTGFTIDANPPLAGASYLASVKLLKVEPGPTMDVYQEEADTSSSRYQVATFALGCFWGGELEYMREPGVVGTSVGYTHGDVQDPTYEQVCSGTTMHTEAIAVVYDQEQVSYERLVHLSMDRLEGNKYLPNQVGSDKGTQYRHGVYYHNALQKQVAEEIVGSFGPDCVTECLPAKKYWIAEPYHQQYLLKGGQCARKGERSVIRCYG
jgi:peptide-methionine (S)-S-oxide reductase